MKKWINKLKASLLRAQIAATNFLTEERGDTNFISIAIILVIILAIAVVFITLGKDILPKLKQAVSELLSVF